MKPFACRYAIVQFVPYIETGEFANVGVVLTCPQTGYFDFKLQTRRHSRVTDFFDELRKDTYLTAIKAIQTELQRIQCLVVTISADPKRTENIRNLFIALTHPREAIIRFGAARPILTVDPARQLEELFDHYVERNFVTPEYIEQTIAKRIQKLLDGILLPAPFKSERIGDDQIYAHFPLVQRVNDRLTKVIKPFNLTQNEANAIYAHGDIWLQKVRRLRKRQLLPLDVLFTIAAPPFSDTKRFDAYQEICTELQEENVKVVREHQETEILTFAAN